MPNTWLMAVDAAAILCEMVLRHYNDRYQSCADFADALSVLLGHVVCTNETAVDTIQSDRSDGLSSRW